MVHEKLTRCSTCVLSRYDGKCDGWGEGSGAVKLTVGKIIAIILSVFELLLLRYGLG
jgi:hypothetical protein